MPTESVCKAASVEMMKRGCECERKEGRGEGRREKRRGGKEIDRVCMFVICTLAAERAGVSLAPQQTGPPVPDWGLGEDEDARAAREASAPQLC